MGIFDWLRGDRRDPRPAAKAGAAAQPLAPSLVPTAARSFSRHRDDLFDLARTATLHHLLAVAAADRDEAWFARFFDAAWHGSVQMPAEQPFTGPDGFAYLRFDIPHPGAFDSQSIGNLAPALVERGVGAALFATPDDPIDAARYVFSMGQLDAMLRFDSAAGDPVDIAELARGDDPVVWDVADGTDHQRLTLRHQHQVLVGSPSADYLPPATARALYRHLVQGWKIAEPRVALMQDPAMSPSRTLVIGRRADGFGEGQDVDGATRMLLWYFPPRRKLMLQPDSMSVDEMALLSGYLGDRAPANDSVDGRRISS